MSTTECAGILSSGQRPPVYVKLFPRCGGGFPPGGPLLKTRSVLTTGVSHGPNVAVSDGLLTADDQLVYTATDLRVRLFEAGAHSTWIEGAAGEIL